MKETLMILKAELSVVVATGELVATFDKKKYFLIDGFVYKDIEGEESSIHPFQTTYGGINQYYRFCNN